MCFKVLNLWVIIIDLFIDNLYQLLCVKRKCLWQLRDSTYIYTTCTKHQPSVHFENIYETHRHLNAYVKMKVSGIYEFHGFVEIHASTKPITANIFMSVYVLRVIYNL